MDTFSTAQVAKRFTVADQTVKNWAAEFASYLSPTATPEAGKRRAFTAEDVAILALVHELVGRGRDTAAAHAALQAGQRGAVKAITVANDADALITVQRERDMAQGALIELRSMLDTIKVEAQQQVERTQQQAQEQADRLNARIIELERQLARADMKIELLESGDLKPKHAGNLNSSFSFCHSQIVW